MRIRSDRLLVAPLLLVALLATACPKNSAANGGSVSGGPSTTSPGVTGATGSGTTGPTGPSGASGVSGSTGSGAGMDLTGKWKGTWTNTTPDHSTGDFEIDWMLDHGVLRGTIVVNGTPCLNRGTIAGALALQRINFGAVSGQVEVFYTGRVDQNGKTMFGTYETSCGNAKGTWKATKEP